VCKLIKLSYCEKGSHFYYGGGGGNLTHRVAIKTSNIIFSSNIPNYRSWRKSAEKNSIHFLFKSWPSCTSLLTACLRFPILTFVIDNNSVASLLISRATTEKSGFYRAMLCIRDTSHGPVSVCPSVTSRCSTETTKCRITQTKSHDSSGTLVFRRQRSPRNSTGINPYESAKCRWGGSKSATFDK